MASVTASLGNAYGGAVQWTYVYDDQTLAISSVTCVNSLSTPVTCTFLFGKQLNRSQTETIQPGTTTVSVASFNLNLQADPGGGLSFAFPFDLQA